MLIFQRKSSPINGRYSLGVGSLNAPSLGSTIPDVSVKIMRFPSLLPRLWLKSPISIPYSSAYEYRFLFPQAVQLLQPPLSARNVGGDMLFLTLLADLTGRIPSAAYSLELLLRLLLTSFRGFFPFGQGQGDHLVAVLLEAHDNDPLGGPAALLDGLHRRAD